MSALVEAMARGIIEAGYNPATAHDIALACLRAMADVEPSDGMCRAAVWSLEKAKEQAGKLQHDRPFKAQEKHAIRYRAMLRQAVAEAEKGRET